MVMNDLNSAYTILQSKYERYIKISNKCGSITGNMNLRYIKVKCLMAGILYEGYEFVNQKFFLNQFIQHLYKIKYGYNSKENILRLFFYLFTNEE